ncbi:alpha/beta fold hydrolase [Kocuria koreensis]|jgi:carboxylesterase|uniref:Alpha/beta fold hydrolase n=1 Tax=Rothia koreensis TaxID=592378 RepID=A0A7K1LHG9_9MICC|nr:alpha/beta fold hydrolase [Rothia koreensis]MUN54626.1 alpha/beta fold hydrolase [Rothia koreensis]
MGHITDHFGKRRDVAPAGRGYSGDVDVSPAQWDGGPDGVLVLHGFTGSPHSVRPLAANFAEAGLAVEMPLLPGHGTTVHDMSTRTWREWTQAVDEAYWNLRSRAEKVAVAGLSMGGALALHLAARRSVEAVVLVNPGVVDPVKGMAWARWLAYAIPKIRGVGDDIAKPGVTEGSYPQAPLRGAAQLHELFKETRRVLPAVTAPVQIYRSLVDHVVSDASHEYLMTHLVPEPELVPLPSSYHVATLDHDAPTIFRGSLAFLDRCGLRLPVHDSSPLPTLETKERTS